MMPRPSGTFARALVLLLLGLLVLGGAANPKNAYLDDLAALFEELDAHYPFFEVKGIERHWKAAKKELAKRAHLCRSDDEFTAILVDTLKALRDGHCSLEETKGAWPKQNLAWPGVALLPATKGRVVVLSTSGNLKSLLPPGTLITKIDGKPAYAALERRTQIRWLEGGFFSSPQRARLFEYRNAFTGERGSKTSIHYLDGRKQKKVTLVANQELKGWAHHYHLPESLAQVGKSAWHTELEGGIGYVYPRRMDESVTPGLRAAVTAHPDVKGWIVDLRGNSGGGYDEEVGRARRELGNRVAGLIDAGTISAGETFARDLVRGNQAKLFGETTAGSSSTKRRFTLPSGFATVRFSDATRRGPKGKGIEFHGVVPDFTVEVVPEEFRAGKNSAIERAREWLLKE